MIDVPDDIKPTMEEEVQKGPPPAIDTVIQPSSIDPPSAPQVEDNVDSTGLIVQESILQPQDGAKDLAPPSVRPRTRSIARFEGFVIPEPRDISDSEEDEEALRQVTTPLPRPRTSKSSATPKNDSKSRHKPLTTLNVTPNFTTRSAKAMELELLALEKRLLRTGQVASTSRKTSSTPTHNSSSEACPAGATSNTDDEMPSLVLSSFEEENNM